MDHWIDRSNSLLKKKMKNTYTKEEHDLILYALQDKIASIAVINKDLPAKELFVLLKRVKL